MRNAFKSFLLACIAMFAGVFAFAQVTTSSLAGKVADQNGEAVPGAAIVAVHVPSGTSYGAVTNTEGRYTIQGMRTGGPYKVEVSCLGYRSVEYTDVTLQLGEIYNLNAKLDESSEFLSEALVIASPTSKFAAQEKTGATTNISNEDILSLPLPSRSITDVAKLSPYGGNGMSFAGGDGRSANFTIDGANFNNNFGLSEKLPGGGVPVSLDAIEEVQVVVSPYDVRQSNFIGGGVNAIRVRSMPITRTPISAARPSTARKRPATTATRPFTARPSADRSSRTNFSSSSAVSTAAMSVKSPMPTGVLPTTESPFRTSTSPVRARRTWTRFPSI